MVQIGGIAFAAWFVVINFWCLLKCGRELRRMIVTQETNDRTLSPMSKVEHPRLFYMQAVGFAGMMICNLGIICLIAAFAWQAMTK